MISIPPARSVAACLVTAAALLASPTTRGDDPPVTRAAVCRWTDRPPTIDGSLDDPAWQGATVIDHFPSFWKGTDPGPAHATRARLLWDRDGLYFAAELTDADVRAFGTRRNDHLWNGDVFELFFKPSRDRPAYYEFQVNPRSVLFEAAFTARSRPTESFATSPARGMVAVARVRGTLDQPGDSDGGWTVEEKIPWSAFGPTDSRPEPGASWSFALCRYDYFGPDKTPPIQVSSAPLTQLNFHRFEDYGLLRFAGPGEAK